MRRRYWLPDSLLQLLVWQLPAQLNSGATVELLMFVVADQ
jgi:hypothetical protein